VTPVAVRLGVTVSFVALCVACGQAHQRAGQPTDDAGAPPPEMEPDPDDDDGDDRSSASRCIEGGACNTGRACEVGAYACRPTRRCVAVALVAAGTPCRGDDACGATCDGERPECPAEHVTGGRGCPRGECSDGWCVPVDGCAEPCALDDPCVTGVTDCTLGGPVCTPAGTAPEGTPCEGGTCDGHGLFEGAAAP